MDVKSQQPEVYMKKKEPLICFHLHHRWNNFLGQPLRLIQVLAFATAPGPFRRYFTVTMFNFAFSISFRGKRPLDEVRMEIIRDHFRIKAAKAAADNKKKADDEAKRKVEESREKAEAWKRLLSDIEKLIRLAGLRQMPDPRRRKKYDIN